MEDFIERVGQSYLERKAFAVPQQLENFAKRQLTGEGGKEAEAEKSTGKKATEEKEEGEGETEEEEKGKSKKKKKGNGRTAGQISSGSSEKDKEIAILKKQLAQSKLENSKASSGKSASGLKQSGISRGSNGRKAFTTKAAKGDEKPKGLAALGAVGAVGGKHEERKNKNGNKKASGREIATEANIVEISPTKRRTSTSQHNEHEGGAKSEHGGGPKSEHGGHAKSTTSHAAAASEGKRRASTASKSEHGSTVKSIAPALVPKHLPAHAERSGEESTIVVSRQSRRQKVQEQDVFAVEVEEEVPRRKRKDAGGVVEVETSKGRTLYRI
ncbi:MAG: hypothetical protein Q9161_000450 [Pseudevernia consocians]